MTNFIGAFHIIDGRVPYQTSAVPVPGRRKARTEQFAYALCGQLVVRDRGQYCGLSIASPKMNKPWCRACVESIEFWTPEAMEEWRSKGYFQESPQ